MPVDHLNKPCTLAKAKDTTPLDFFKTVYQTFQQAEEIARGPIDRFYTIAGYTIRLRFASSALVPLITPALEHLASKSVHKPALTVCLWDSTSTCTNMPPPPWSRDDYIARGEVRGYNNGLIHAAFNMDAGVLSMLYNNLNLAFFWIRDASQLPYYESGAPLKTILHWWMRSNKCQLIHSAAVGTLKGGVLLAGKGGSGKSTTALACLHSDMLYVGDDYVLLGKEAGPFVYSIYNSAKLGINQIQRLTHLLPAISNFERLDTEKVLIFLNNYYPDKIAMGFPVQAILLPHVTGLPETRLKKALPAAALKALAPSTIFQLAGAGFSDFKYLTNFIKKVPSYVLELGSDLSRIPDVILDLLSED